MNIPTIFWTFAHYPSQSEYSLEFLRREKRVLNRLNLPLSIIKFISDPSNVRELSDDLEEFRNRLVIFHLSGHHDSELFKFGKGTSLRNDNFINLIKGERNLKLVFLNGCETREHVQKFLEVGIPIIIAANAKVSDEDAMNFAITFYRSFFNKDSIETSFLKATSTVYPDIINNAVIQDSRSDSKEIWDEKRTTLLPYGLFVKEAKVKDFTLTDLIEGYFPFPSPDALKNDKVEKNTNPKPIRIFREKFIDKGDRLKTIESDAFFPLSMKCLLLTYDQDFWIKPLLPHYFREFCVRFRRSGKVNTMYILDHEESLNFGLEKEYSKGKWIFRRFREREPIIIRENEIHYQIDLFDFYDYDVYHFVRISTVDEPEHYLFIICDNLNQYEPTVENTIL